MEKKKGANLDNSEAHVHDHRCWSRRSFLSTLGAAGIGSAAMFGSRPINVLGQSSFTSALSAADSNRILVLIQLDGGNDGLNTIVPISNDLYYNYRPNLAIARNDVIQIDNDTGFHPEMAPIRPFFDQGQMAIIQNVGYPESSHSHFRGTDIWLSGGDRDNFLDDGWMGRYLHHKNPELEENPPEKPLALQVGVSNQLFRSGSTSVGMSFASQEVFNRLVESGQLNSLENIPNTLYGAEMEYVREVANSSVRYAGQINDAGNRGRNIVSYPGDTENDLLSSRLATVAKMIDGDLDSRVYQVSMDGFDTHGNQPRRHRNLWRELSESIKLFLDDLEALGHADRVMVMTFSEFGRTVKQNGSLGTDHGAGAPLILFGRGVNGGFFGDQPDLSRLNRFDDPEFGIDYRSVYHEVIRDWFGLPESSIPGILEGPVDNLGFVSSPIFVDTEGNDLPDQLATVQVYPNPASTVLNIETNSQGDGKVFDIAGRAVLDISLAGAGTRLGQIEISRLPAGTYIIQMNSGERTTFVKVK